MKTLSTLEFGDTEGKAGLARFGEPNLLGEYLEPTKMTAGNDKDENFQRIAGTDHVLPKLTTSLVDHEEVQTTSPDHATVEDRSLDVRLGEGLHHQGYVQETTFTSLDH